MSDKKLLIRQATREDVREVVRLLSDDMLGSQRERYGSSVPQSYYEAFERIERDENNELVVAEMDGEIVATLQLTFLPGMTFQGRTRAQIEAVRVDGRYRGQRLGQQLMKWAIDRARQKGCYLVQLTTDKSRGDAHRFYERLGFVASHEGMKLRLEENL